MQEGNNGQIDYLYEKAQKLTEALYRVTELLSDQEPLKWFLRRQGLHIFETLLNIKTATPNERVKNLELISENTFQMVRALELASSGSFISEANFHVLQREYKALVELMFSQKTNLLPAPIKTESINPIGHSNGQDEAAPTPAEGEVGVPTTKRVGKETEENFEKEDMGGPQTGERRDRIMAFIKQKDWVSVGELAEVFRGETSEKTIQRDLAGMAGEGLLLKEGEKRWRKYKLVI